MLLLHSTTLHHRWQIVTLLLMATLFPNEIWVFFGPNTSCHSITSKVSSCYADISCDAITTTRVHCWNILICSTIHSVIQGNCSLQYFSLWMVYIIYMVRLGQGLHKICTTYKDNILSPTACETVTCTDHIVHVFGSSTPNPCNLWMWFGELIIIMLSGTIGFLKLIQTVKQHHKIDIYSAYTTRANHLCFNRNL